MDSDAEARQIARLIVEFAHTLNLQVIAEGIETSAQVDYLKTWTCEFGQGYFFSKPLDQHGIERWLAAAHGTADFQNGSARSHSAGAE